MEAEANSSDRGECSTKARIDHWDEEASINIKNYLEHGQYPTDLPPSEGVKRRNFRKSAKDFVVQADQLYYQGKTLRLAISSKEEQQRIFQVGKD